VSLSGLIIELTATCKNFAEKLGSSRSTTDLANVSVKTGMPHMTDTLLFQITRSFRKRLFKVWEKIIESDRMTISHTTIQQQQQQGGGGAGEDNNNPISSSVQSDHLLEVLDDNAPYMKYVEAWAFRTPAPVMSAGTASVGVIVSMVGCSRILWRLLSRDIQFERAAHLLRHCEDLLRRLRAVLA
jgi:hypothetical protein